MEYARLLSFHHFDISERRINSIAFRNSNDRSGISVIQMDCAIQKSGCICTHVDKHKQYKHLITEPVSFWKLDDSIIPKESSFHQDNSNGDDCHFNLTDITDRQARKLFKDSYKDNLWSCNDGNLRSTTLNELINIFISVA
jgi:hypothetical protein